MTIETIIYSFVLLVLTKSAHFDFDFRKEIVVYVSAQKHFYRHLKLGLPPHSNCIILTLHSLLYDHFALNSDFALMYHNNCTNASRMKCTHLRGILLKLCGWLKILLLTMKKKTGTHLSSQHES